MGKPIVLKLTIDEASLKYERSALTAFSGYGTVALLDYQSDALLLQRVLPGITLKGHPKAIKIACEVIKKLNRAPIPSNHHFPHISNWLSILDKPWDMPSAFLEKARKIKKELLKAPYPDTLLHGDLHLDNILLNQHDWLVIDPKGVIGFPIIETVKCIEDPEHDLKYISDYFGYPIDHVVRWYYLYLLLAACWQIEDNQDPKPYLNLAGNIDIKIKY